jgi:hypothetical protein
MKILYKCSRSAHFWSIKMHIRILGFSAVFGISLVQWRHHRSGPGVDIGMVRLRVGLFCRMLHVKFHHKIIISLARIKSYKYEIQI